MFGKDAKKPTAISTQSQLAKLVDRDPSQISRWVKDSRWPFGPPPWPSSKLPEILRWAADTLRESDVKDADPELLALKKRKLEQEIRKLTTQADVAATELSRLRDELMPVEEVRQWIGQHVTAARQKLLSLGPRIAPLMDAMEAPERDAFITQHVTEILNDLSAAGERVVAAEK